MDRAIAEQLIQEYLNYGATMNRLVELTAHVGTEDRRRILGADAEACFALYEGIVRTVMRYYPDLEPKNHRTDS